MITPDNSELKKTLMELQDAHQEFAKLEHDYINRYIDAADRKAGVSFAASTAALVYFIENENGLRWLNLLDINITCLFAFVACVALIWSSVSSFQVILPRLVGNPSGLVFWQAVAKRSAASDYAAEILNSTPEALRIARLEHCYELAKVCESKFSVLNRAMAIGAVGITFFLVMRFADAVIDMS